MLLSLNDYVLTGTSLCLQDWLSLSWWQCCYLIIPYILLFVMYLLTSNEFLCPVLLCSGSWDWAATCATQKRRESVHGASGDQASGAAHCYWGNTLKHIINIFPLVLGRQSREERGYCLRQFSCVFVCLCVSFCVHAFFRSWPGVCVIWRRISWPLFPRPVSLWNVEGRLFRRLSSKISRKAQTSLDQFFSSKWYGLHTN